jgi:hypothetical protein
VEHGSLGGLFESGYKIVPGLDFTVKSQALSFTLNATTVTYQYFSYTCVYEGEYYISYSHTDIRQNFITEIYNDDGTLAQSIESGLHSGTYNQYYVITIKLQPGQYVIAKATFSSGSVVNRSSTCALAFSLQK